MNKELTKQCYIETYNFSIDEPRVPHAARLSGTYSQQPKYRSKLMKYRVPQRLCDVLLGAAEKHLSKLQGSNRAKSDIGKAESTAGGVKVGDKSWKVVMMTSCKLSPG